jgi:RNA polymerase sigma factor (sigma-70 family)
MKNKNNRITATGSSTKKTILPLSDENLICFVMAGHQQAYAEFVKRYERLLLSVVSRYCADPESQKEIIQDTFIRAFKALPDFRRESKLSTWLCRIAVSAAINRLRLRRNAAWAALEDSSIFEISVEPEGYQEVEKKESYHLLRQAIGQLSERDAMAIHLFYFNENSMEEISHKTGWTLSNIKSRLSRARVRLREVMESDQMYEVVYS